MKIYLAGRVHSRKTELIPSPAKSTYVASDLWEGTDAEERVFGFTHDDPTGYPAFEHGWKDPNATEYHDEPNLDREEIVRGYAEPLIREAQIMIAYVDDCKAFGTIAEIGMANGIGIPILLFKHYPHHPIPTGRYQLGESDHYINEYNDDEMNEYQHAEHLLEDAYWFVSYLSNVWNVDASDFSVFQNVVKQVDQIESPIELALYLRLRYLGVHTQYRVGKYRLDFAFPDKKLAVECDGHAYHSTRDQRGRDADRDRELIAQGWTVIRFTGSQIHENPERCADEVKRILYTGAATA